MDPELPLKELIETVRDDTGYTEELKKEDAVEAETRMENIGELINKAASYEETAGRTAGTAAMEGAAAEGAAGNGHGDGRLWGFLEEVSLLSDLDRTNDTDDVLTMMTLHGAKGLEFDKVYLCGMEEGLFPSGAAINADDPEKEIEEERRLCYVGITRARRSLRLSSARERMVQGETRYQRPSRFIEELSEDACDKTLLRVRPATWEDYDDDYDRPIPKRGFAGGRQRGDGLFNGFSGGKNAYSDYTDYNSFNTGGAFASGRLGNFGSLDTGRPARKGRAALGATGASMEKVRPDYGVGDRVSHIKFGEGTVQEIKEGSKDYEVTVEFDDYGVKRMFAGFAKLKKI